MIAMLPDDLQPRVERREDKVSMIVNDPDAASPADELHGFLLTPDQAISAAEELMASAGEIVGADVAVTIDAETFTGGTRTFAGEPVHMVIATDRDQRTVRIAFHEDALRKLAAQIALVLGQGEPKFRH
jgi:hypothetical protein